MSLLGDAFEGAHGDGPSSDDSHPMRTVRPMQAVASDAVVHDVEKDRVLAELGLTQDPALRRFGRYIVLGVLGRGGMGTVLKAYDDELAEHARSVFAELGELRKADLAKVEGWLRRHPDPRREAHAEVPMHRPHEHSYRAFRPN